MTRYMHVARALRTVLICNRPATTMTPLRCNHGAAATNESFQPPTPDHIKSIVEQISQLKFYEVALLNDCLRKTLNIPDISLASAGPGNAAEANADDDVAQAAAVKTSYTVKLQKFDDSKKVSLIKEIKKLVEGINLVEAKRFVEDCPKVIRANIPKDEAEALKKQLEDAGATVVVE